MSDKVLLITGASSGIGRATALKAAQNGYKLALLARRENKLKEIVDEIGEDRAIALPTDVTNLEELGKAIHKTVERFGKIDAVYANAGKGLESAGTENGDPREWDQLIDLNVKALLWTAKMTLQHLRQTKGHFLITSSVAGKIYLPGSVYGASKWFASGFGHNLAREMKEWGGRCTVICPGMVDTDFFDEPKPDKLKPEDIADAVVFALNAPSHATVREIEVMPTN
ncbi:MAG: SDR family oxidoreductase [Bacteriovoracaceae bacterium]|nr:SDR family oxidoreductase [Bacteriovoracaceae bacterium]